MDLKKELSELSDLIRKIKIEIVMEIKENIENEFKNFKKRLIEENPYMSFL
jgi:mRNA-degrading endonuclease RelE of RelBE toxin-antitoxin system